MFKVIRSNIQTAITPPRIARFISGEWLKRKARNFARILITRGIHVSLCLCVCRLATYGSGLHANFTNVLVCAQGFSQND